MCSVFMQESEKVVSISSDHLEPVTPTKNNKVRWRRWLRTLRNAMSDISN